MKIAVTNAAISLYADALAAEGAHEQAARLRSLTALSTGLASRPMNELLRLLDRAEPSAKAGEPNVSLALASLRNLQPLIEGLSSRNRLNDFTAFLKRLEQHESATIPQLINAVQSLRRGKRGGEPVQPKEFSDLATRLKAALGRDDEFNPLFEQLSALDAEGVARVTNALMSSGTSKSRSRDLQKIRERHESHRALLAKRRAMAGRSAA